MFVAKSPRLFIFLLAWLTGLLVQSGDLGSDTSRRLQVAHSFWTNEPEVLKSDTGDFGIPGRGGTPHAWYGIGQSAVMVPADVLATVVARRLPEAMHLRVREVIVELIVFPLLAALGALLSFMIAVELGTTTRAALFCTLGFIFCTSFLPYTQINQENSLLFVTTTLGIYSGLRWLRTGGIGALATLSAALGLGLTVRATAIVDFVAIGLFVLIVRMRSEASSSTIRQHVLGLLLACAVGMLLGGGIDRIYHWVRFGSLTTNYIALYGEWAKARDATLPASYPFSTPFWVGLSGALIKPDRSVLVFDPVLLSIPFIGLTIKSEPSNKARTLLVCSMGMLVAHAVFYARYYDWFGGACWGDRFCANDAALASFVALVLAALNWPLLSAARRRLVCLTIAAASLVQLVSVPLWYVVEEDQMAKSPGTAPQLVWRLMNLKSYILGSLPAELNRIGMTAHSSRLNFLPFAASEHVPARVAQALLVVWLLGLFVWLTLMVGAFLALRGKPSLGEQPILEG